MRLRRHTKPARDYKNTHKTVEQAWKDPVLGVRSVLLCRFYCFISNGAFFFLETVLTGAVLLTEQKGLASEG